MATVPHFPPHIQSMAARYPVGKLPHPALERLLERHVVRGSRDVLVGPAIGEDAAALLVDEPCLVAASDPITFATDAIGYYAVHVNANDVVTMGARPRWFLATVLLPPGARDQDVERIFADIAAACAQVGAAWCGGHSEVSAGLPRPVVVGTMLGTLATESVLRSADARPDDRLLCTKRVPLEATSLIARERPEWTRERIGEVRLRRCQELLYEPGISVVPEALAAAGAGAHALHDPTEGGLATGLHELADAAGVGLEVDAELLPLDPDGEQLCAAAGIDPLGALASGSLLIAVPAERHGQVLAAVAALGVECREIGRLLPAEAGRTVRVAGERRDLPTFAVDEIARLWEQG